MLEREENFLCWKIWFEGSLLCRQIRVATPLKISHIYTPGNMLGLHKVRSIATQSGKIAFPASACIALPGYSVASLCLASPRFDLLFFCPLLRFAHSHVIRHPQVLSDHAQDHQSVASCETYTEKRSAGKMLKFSA